jgi:hypothetical protein
VTTLIRSLPSLALLACVLSAATAAAQGVTVVEMRNALRDRYFLTADPAEVAALESGAVGPGWGRTGRTFGGIATAGNCPQCPPVTRYYNAALGSHFYTSNPAEMEWLRQPGSGWMLERIEFRQSQIYPVTPPGPCSNLGFHGWSVYRFYSPQSGHRYVGSGLRETMRNKGWIDEGLALCLLSEATQPFKQFSMPTTLSDRVRNLDECKSAADPQPCLALTNLAAGDIAVDDTLTPTRIRFATSGRSPGTLANAGPYYPLVGTGRDNSFRPFAGYAVETELVLRYTIYLYKAEPGDTASHVYGHPTIEFIDRDSGMALHFSALTFGSNAGADYLGRDAITGATIVGTTYRPSTPYGRSIDTPTLRVPLEAPIGVPRGFQFAMNRAEFQRVLDSARQFEPRLSNDPASYAVTAFRYKNEAVGNGAFDTGVWQLSLSLWPAD